MRMTTFTRTLQPVEETLPHQGALLIPADRVVRWNWSGQVFYLLSILVHIAAVAALSISWARNNSEPKRPSASPPSRLENHKIARLAIDLAPVRFCEMKIENLINQIPPPKNAKPTRDTRQPQE